MQIKEYYSTEDEFDRIHTNLKLLLCPLCHTRGLLILHGFLYGYAPKEVVLDRDKFDMVQRGHRIFCNNRKKRKGCGKTFSLLLAGCIRNFAIFAQCLSVFLENIRQGVSLAEAFRQANSSMSTSTVYRLYNRFRSNQSVLVHYS